jgi:outer membrane protein TolC
MERRNSWRSGVLLLAAGLLAINAADAVAAMAETPTGSSPLTLDRAISAALDQSPAVQSANWKATADHDQASAVNRTRWGRLDAVASMSRFDEDRLLVPMSRQLLANGLPNAPFDRDQIHYGLTYQVPLYLGGKLSASVEIAKFEAEKSEALRQGTRWQVRFNVVSLYSGVQTLDGAIKASESLIETLDAVQKRLELMVTSGKRPELDLLKVKDQMGEAKAQLAALQAQRTKVAGLLLALLGEDPGRPLAVTPLADFDPQFNVPVDSLTTMALASSPVKQAQLSASQAGSGIKAARAGFLPSVVGQADYLAHHADSVDSDPTTWQLSVGVKLPLFNGTSRFAALAAARAGQRAADEGLKLARLAREADLNDALARLQAARTGLTAAKARVASATEAARSEQIRYDTGASTIEDLLRARTREEAAHTALAQATGELRTAAEQINAVVETEVIR